MFDLAATASLLLCIAAVVLWVRSELVWDEWNLLGPPRGANRTSVIRLTVTSVNGGLGLKLRSADDAAVSAGAGPPLGLVWHQRSSGRPSPTAYPNSSIPDNWPWYGFVFEHRGINFPP